MKNLLLRLLAMVAATNPELLEQALAEAVAAVGYRDDGWSDATNRGCRRHQTIDQKIDELRGGDEYDRQVADEAAAWFCFHPDRFADQLAESDEENGMARGAYNRIWGAALAFQGKSGLYPLDFRVPLAEPDPPNNRFFEVIDSHAVVFDPSGKQDAPAVFPDEYAASLDAKADRLREAGESDDTQPGVSPG